MPAILVVPDRSFDGGVDHGAAELIGAASALGTPVVLADDAAHVDELGSLGAATVLVASQPRIDAVSAAYAATHPDAVLFSHTVRGREAAGRFAVRERLALLTDAVALREDLATARRAVVIGAGFIGCEAAASLAARGIDTTMVTVEAAPQRGRLG